MGCGGKEASLVSESYDGSGAITLRKKTDLDGVHGTDGHTGDGHARKDVAGDLKEAHHKGPVEHVPRRFPDPPPVEGRDARPPPLGVGRGRAIRGTVRVRRRVEVVLVVVARGLADAFAEGEDEDAVAGDKGELDKGEGDGVAEAGEDGFAGVGGEGGGEVPEAAEGDEADGRRGGQEGAEGRRRRCVRREGRGRGGGREAGEKGAEGEVVVLLLLGGKGVSTLAVTGPVACEDLPRGRDGAAEHRDYEVGGGEPAAGVDQSAITVGAYGSRLAVRYTLGGFPLASITGALSASRQRFVLRLGFKRRGPMDPGTRGTCSPSRSGLSGGAAERGAGCLQMRSCPAASCLCKASAGVVIGAIEQARGWRGVPPPAPRFRDPTHAL